MVVAPGGACCTVCQYETQIAPVRSLLHDRVILVQKENAPSLGVMGRFRMNWI